MSEVKRYNPELEKDIGLGLPCLSMLSNPYGEWVKYDDYAALQRKLDEVTESRDQWKANAHEFSRCADRLEEKLGAQLRAGEAK